MKQALIVIAIGAAALTLVLPSILFVSIVWTHRPDLSILDIALLAIREIREIMDDKDIITMKAGDKLRRKGKWKI